MKYIKSLFWVLLAGTCSGIFFYVRSFPSIRMYAETGIDSHIIWAYSSLSQLGIHLLIANLVLVLIWLLYSFVYSKFWGISLNEVLLPDTYTYLPLCALAISLSQFNTFLTYHFEAFLLISRNFGNLLLLIALIGVYHLKMKNHHELQRTGTHRFSSNASDDVITWKKALIVFLISLLIYAAVGFRINKKLVAGGDEPHYLLITHSLLYDHDLVINNNYNQKDYQAFFPGILDPHVSIGKDKTRYSIHPIGVSFLLLPGYALNGRQGAIFVMNVLAALLALLLYAIALAITQNNKLSLIVWGVTSFTSPLLIYSSQLYPEVPSALLLGTAFYIIHFHARKKNIFLSVLLGSSLVFLPWLQQRMILPSVILAGYYLIQTQLVPWNKEWKKHLTVCTLFPLFCLVGTGMIMAGYYYLLYGNPLPNAPYLSIGIKSVFSLKILLQEGLLGLLLDQEAGLLIFSPYYLFIFTGLFLFLRRRVIHALVLLALIFSIYLPCGGFVLKWRGAWSPVSRYMVALIPLLVVPLCISMKHLTRNMYRYVFFVTAMIGAFWSYLFLKTPSASLMSRNGINNIFEQSGNIVNLTRYFPSFNPTSSNSFLLAGMWLTVILVFSFVMYRSSYLSLRRREPSQVSLPLEYRAVQQVSQVFGWYLLMFGVLLIFSRIAIQTENSATPQFSKNNQARQFLSHFDYDVLINNQVQQQYPLVGQQLRFKYLYNERRGYVDQQRGERFLVTGPREPFPKGWYIAYFKMSAEKCASEDLVATIDIIANQGKFTFQKISLFGKDFAIDDDKLLPVSFELPIDVNDLETRVYFHNNTNLTVEDIYIEPDVSEFYYRTGLLAAYHEDYEKAQTLFSRAAFASKHFLSLYQLGVIEQKLGNWEHALEIFQRVVKRNPKFADGFYRLGLAFQQLGDASKARSSFKKTIRLLYTHLDAWNAMKEIDRQRQRGDEVQEIEDIIHKFYHPEHPATINIANQIMFLGYTAQNLKPGILRIEYYWEALSPMKNDYMFFVHFKNDDTRVQQDHAPQILDRSSGQHQPYPTSSWKVGEVIREEFEITLPKGDFAISLGVWDQKENRPLPIISSEEEGLKGKINLPSITVQ